MTQVYTFMLLSDGGWSFELFNTSTLIGTIIVNLTLLLGLKKIAKTFNCYQLIIFGLIMAGISFVISSSVVYCEDFSSNQFAILWTVGITLLQFSISLVLVTVIGRISRRFPAGVESTGTTLVFSIRNIAMSAGLYLSSELVQVYGVHAGYYQRIQSPQILLVSLTIGLIALSPFFLPK